MMPDRDGYAVLEAVRPSKATATTPFIFLTANGEKAELRAGMNFGADDYLVKPASRVELLEAIHARFERQRINDARLKQELAKVSFQPDFTSFAPLVERLGLTDREAETLLWVAQGKANADIATILGISEKTVKKTLGRVFDKLGVESRTAAALRAVELLNIANPAARRPSLEQADRFRAKRFRFSRCPIAVALVHPMGSPGSPGILGKGTCPEGE